MLRLVWTHTLAGKECVFSTLNIKYTRLVIAYVLICRIMLSYSTSGRMSLLCVIRIVSEMMMIAVSIVLIGLNNRWRTING